MNDEELQKDLPLQGALIIDEAAERRSKTIDIGLHSEILPSERDPEIEAKILPLISDNSFVLLIAQHSLPMADHLRRQKSCTVKEVRGHIIVETFQKLLRDETFQHVVLHECLNVVESPIELFRIAASSLPNGGSIIATVPNAAHATRRLAILQGEQFIDNRLLPEQTRTSFTKHSLVSMLAAAGLVDISLERVKAKSLDIALENKLRNQLGDLYCTAVDADPEAETETFIVEAVPMRITSHADLLNKRQSETTEEASMIVADRIRMAEEARRSVVESALRQEVKNEIADLRNELTKVMDRTAQLMPQLSELDSRFNNLSQASNNAVTQITEFTGRLSQSIADSVSTLEQRVLQVNPETLNTLQERLTKIESRLSDEQLQQVQQRLAELDCQVIGANTKAAAVDARLSRYLNCAPLRLARAMRRAIFRV